MADQQTNWILELVDKITAPVKEITGGIDKLEDAITHVDEKLEKVGNDSAKAFDKSNTSLKMLAFQASSEAITNLGQPLLDGAKGAYAYDASLKELSAITGVVGDDLDLIGSNARQSAIDFGGDASESVKSYTLLLSKLAPEIAENPAALAAMGKSVSLLSETMHGDLVGATNAASSVMNQFGVDLSDPAEAAKTMDSMLNQIAASAKVGNQEVVDVAQAIDNVGAVAKNANVSFSETNAALQVLGKYGKTASEGGIALRNVMMTLSEKDFLPPDIQKNLKAAGVSVDVLADKSLTFEQRLAELKKISGNDALLGKMFGKENTVAIVGLLNEMELMHKYNGVIVSDQTALADMAATMGTSYQESKDRIVSYFDDIKLSIYGATGEMLPFMDIGLQGIMGVVDLAPGLMAMKGLYDMLKASTVIQTIAQWDLNLAMEANPIGAVVLAITALVAIVSAIVIYYDEWGAAATFILGPLGWIVNLVMSFVKHWDSITEAFSKGGVLAGFKRIGAVIFDAILYPLQQMLGLIEKITGYKIAGGFDSKSIGEMRHKLSLDENDPKKAKEKEKPISAAEQERLRLLKLKEEGGKFPPIVPSSIGADKSGGASSTGGKIITMTLNVYNTYKVAKEDLSNFERITEHVVGRINDTMKDALIAAGS
ncbi:phage tail tape measure protein [Flavobacterium sp. LS1P28]|uniref:phage tail tape measure protein n=1 Tax=Flavobacterium sp. LS1P28 TaxID=2497752 RepID=UPI000F84E3B6|nr:phage tail tape measure protein [Flavobacterium sp. LS1P28]RTY80680.1 phage tail tape measure protein [Flavobacterium sp. LS1P28]